MKQENILKAITSAIVNVEDSIKTHVKRGEKKVAYSAWRAASDLEYALFLFSIMNQDETETLSWKPNLKSKQLEIEPWLISTRDLLKEAKNCFEADEFHEAHKKTWIARGQLLKIQDLLEKRHRKNEKSSS